MSLVLRAGKDASSFEFMQGATIQQYAHCVSRDTGKESTGVLYCHVEEQLSMDNFGFGLLHNMLSQQVSIATKQITMEKDRREEKRKEGED